MNFYLIVVLEKMVNLKKKEGDKKTQKDYIHLVICIIDQIDYLNLKLL